MGRPDLRSAFTKIHLWNQTQFSKIVYIDADVVALRAPEELFALPHPFSAAPDIGWPDLFNTGVMVVTPDPQVYSQLAELAASGTSFDGADQGLLNQHYGQNYNRISFKYNVTPSAHYQYVPAYLHFKDSISLVHFIGSGKPWAQGRVTGAQDGPHTELVSKWWAVYDRHYGSQVGVVLQQQPSEEMAANVGRTLTRPKRRRRRARRPTSASSSTLSAASSSRPAPTVST
jgi:glycogenin glucosyltransferase